MANIFNGIAAANNVLNNYYRGVDAHRASEKDTLRQGIAQKYRDGDFQGARADLIELGVVNDTILEKAFLEDEERSAAAAWGDLMGNGDITAGDALKFDHSVYDIAALDAKKAKERGTARAGDIIAGITPSAKQLSMSERIAGADAEIDNKIEADRVALGVGAPGQGVQAPQSAADAITAASAPPAAKPIAAGEQMRASALISGSTQAPQNARQTVYDEQSASAMIRAASSGDAQQAFQFLRRMSPKARTETYNKIGEAYELADRLERSGKIRQARYIRAQAAVLTKPFIAKQADIAIKTAANYAALPAEARPEFIRGVLDNVDAQGIHVDDDIRAMIEDQYPENDHMAVALWAADMGVDPNEIMGMRVLLAGPVSPWADGWTEVETKDGVQAVSDTDPRVSRNLGDAPVKAPLVQVGDTNPQATAPYSDEGLLQAQSEAMGVPAYLVEAARPASEEYSKGEYSDWTSTGRANTTRNVQNLNSAFNGLIGSEGGDWVTGPVVNLVPDFALAFSDDGQNAIATRQNIEGVIQQTLRETLGAQFTEKEGMMVLQRTFDPKLDEAENGRRLLALSRAALATAQAKEQKAQYFDDYGNLAGLATSPEGAFWATLEEVAPELVEEVMTGLGGLDQNEQAGGMTYAGNQIPPQAIEQLDGLMRRYRGDQAKTLRAINSFDGKFGDGAAEYVLQGEH